MTTYQVCLMRNPFIFVHYIDIHHSGRFPEGVHRYALQIREGDEYHHEASPGRRVRHYLYWQLTWTRTPYTVVENDDLSSAVSLLSESKYSVDSSSLLSVDAEPSSSSSSPPPPSQYGMIMIIILYVACGMWGRQIKIKGGPK